MIVVRGHRRRPFAITGQNPRALPEPALYDHLARLLEGR